jgi:hypothetical protein
VMPEECTVPDLEDEARAGAERLSKEREYTVSQGSLSDP